MAAAGALSEASEAIANIEGIKTASTKKIDSVSNSVLIIMLNHRLS